MAGESPFFSVAKGALSRTGTHLTGVADSVKSGANFPDVHGAEPYKDISKAMKEFKEDWGKEVRNLEGLTRKAGAKASAAAKIMTDHDTTLGDTIGGFESADA
jgi:hypothetical protein